MGVISQLLNSLNANGNAEGQTQMKNKNGALVADNQQLLDFCSQLVPGNEELVVKQSGLSKYTSSLWIWDEIPKFVMTTKRVEHHRKNSKDTIVEIPFKLTEVNENGDKERVDAILEITPAIIKTKDGVKLMYPGKNEEFIDEALKLLIMEGCGVVDLNDDPVNKLIFALRRCKRTLAAYGHDMSLDVLKTSLEVMTKCSLRIITARGTTATTSILGDIKTISNDEYKRVLGNLPSRTCRDYGRSETEVESGLRLHEVALPEMVSESIARGYYRSIDVEILLSLDDLARDIYRRLSNRYTQPGPGGTSYNLRYSQFVETRRLWKDDFNYNFRQCTKAMNELVEADVIKPGWTYTKIKDDKDRRKVKDVKFYFEASKSFIACQKRAGRQIKEIEKRRLKLVGNKAVALLSDK